MTDKLQTTQSTALEPAPDYIKPSRKGLEDITKSDMLIPRLALAQPLSPQVTEGDPNRIENLKAGDLFNSITGEIYATDRKPIFVQILRKDKPRAMEFRPVEDGGGVLDPNVPLDDPRLKWGADGEKPTATLFRDYLARLLPSGELIALSFKSSGIKVAKQLNGLIALRNRDIFAGRYAISTGIELKPKPHQIFKVANAGWVSAEDLATGEQMFDAVKDLDMATQVDRGQGGPDDGFDPEELERQSKAAGTKDLDM